MPDARSDVWAGVPGQVFEAETQPQPQTQQAPPARPHNPYKAMIMGQAALCSVVAIVSVVAWSNVILPLIEKFNSPYTEMAAKVSPEAAELQMASDKNCKWESFNLRACKAVWAHVSIPSVSETANVNVPHP
jgi:hypothetical protein